MAVMNMELWSEMAQVQTQSLLSPETLVIHSSSMSLRLLLLQTQDYESSLAG